MPHAYATYFDVNYLVKGVAMIRSLLASDPGSSVRVVCLDDDTFRLLARLDIPGLIPVRLAVLEAGLAHERYVTSLISELYTAAMEKRDYKTMQFLDWFVKEQGEEETNANDLITKMELFGADAKGLYMLDAELKARTYTAPSLTL